MDADHQVIEAIGMSNQPSDAVHLLPMLERIEVNTGQLPGALIADAGYCSTVNLSQGMGLGDPLLSEDVGEQVKT